MSIQRAIIRGQIANLVETRNMLTAEVSLQGGDLPSTVWDVYIGTILTPLTEVLQDTATFNSREIQEWTNGAWSTIDDDAISYQGANTVDGQVANQMAGVMIGKTTSKRVVGRKFWSGLAETAITGNVIDALPLAEFVDAFTAWITPWQSLSGSVFTPGVLDKDGNFAPFVGGFVSSFLGTCRRRKPGIGM